MRVPKPTRGGRTRGRVRQILAEGVRGMERGSVRGRARSPWLRNARSGSVPPQGRLVGALRASGRPSYRYSAEVWIRTQRNGAASQAEGICAVGVAADPGGISRPFSGSTRSPGEGFEETVNRAVAEVIIATRPCHCRTRFVEDDGRRAPRVHGRDRAVVKKWEGYTVACGMFPRDRSTVTPGPTEDGDDGHLVGQCALKILERAELAPAMASPLGVVVREERLADKLAQRHSLSIRTPKGFIERDGPAGPRGHSRVDDLAAQLGGKVTAGGGLPDREYREPQRRDRPDRLYEGPPPPCHQGPLDPPTTWTPGPLSGVGYCRVPCGRPRRGPCPYG
jgi:hypothetical protein